MQTEQVQTSDNELLRAVARGDENALAGIYDRYRLILFGLIVRILHSREEAEDVLQEVFLQVWRRAADFDEARGRAFTWLVTVARSRALDRLRALGSRARAPLGPRVRRDPILGRVPPLNSSTHPRTRIPESRGGVSQYAGSVAFATCHRAAI